MKKALWILNLQALLYINNNVKNHWTLVSYKAFVHTPIIMLACSLRCYTSRTYFTVLSRHRVRDRLVFLKLTSPIPCTQIFFFVTSLSLCQEFVFFMYYVGNHTILQFYPTTIIWVIKKLGSFYLIPNNLDTLSF